MRRLAFVLSIPIVVSLACSDAGDSDEAECGRASRPCCAADDGGGCDAGLFCAAFDGAAVPTCQPQRSRQGNAECGEDVHCAGNSCNPDERRCRALPYGECVPEVGCAPGTSGEGHACVENQGVYRCLAVGDGGFWDVCIDDADCDNRDCRSGRCSLGCNVPGDGTGPCAGAPESRACWECLMDTLGRCVDECPDDGADTFFCTQLSECPDSFCALEECGSEICWFLACADRFCEPVACF